MRAAKVQASLRIRAVSPEPSLLAYTSNESRGTFRQKARSLASLNGWACAVKTCHDGMLEDTNSLDSAQIHLLGCSRFVYFFFWEPVEDSIFNCGTPGRFFSLLWSVLYKESNTFIPYMSHSSWLVHLAILQKKKKKKINESSCYLMVVWLIVTVNCTGQFVNWWLVYFIFLNFTSDQVLSCVRQLHFISHLAIWTENQNVIF